MQAYMTALFALGIIVGSCFNVHATASDSSLDELNQWMKLHGAVFGDNADLIVNSKKGLEHVLAVSDSNVEHLCIKGGHTLAEVIKKGVLIRFPKLRALTLGYADSGDRSKDAQLIITEALKTNTSLRVLQVEHMWPGVSLTQGICDALGQNKNTTLIALYLSNNAEYGDQEIQPFYNFLPANNTLQVLYLQNNYLTASGIMALAEAIKHNTTLKLLHLEGNLNCSWESSARLQLIPVLQEACNINKTTTIYFNGAVIKPAH
jgi:hypothetical protein